MDLGGRSVTGSFSAVFVKDGHVLLWRHRGRTHKISREVRDNFFSVSVETSTCISDREVSRIPDYLLR